MGMFKRIDHMEIIPAKVDETIDFYTKTLGFQITRRLPVPMKPMREVMYLRLGDTVVELVIVEGPGKISGNPWQTGYRAIALEVENMAEAVAYLESKGVAISRPPVDLGDSFRCEISDPNGLMIELRQWKE